MLHESVCRNRRELKTLKQNEAQSARTESTQKGVNRRASEIQGTVLGKCLRAWTCMPASVAQSRHAFVGGYSEHVGKMTDTRKQKAKKASEMPIKHSPFVGNMQIG